jgi:hypothetical protein
MTDDSLLIMCLDFSKNMDKLMFIDGSEYAISKLIVLRHAVVEFLMRLKLTNCADHMYIAVIGFTEEASLLGLLRASDINDDKHYLNNWFDLAVQNIRRAYGNESDITSGLMLAKKFYDRALACNFGTFNISEFQPIYYLILDSKNNNFIDIPNIRVVICSAGIQSPKYELTNPFDDVSLSSFHGSLSGVVSILFGNNEIGYENMFHLCGICLAHEAKGLIVLNEQHTISYMMHSLISSKRTGILCGDCIQMPTDYRSE